MMKTFLPAPARLAAAFLAAAVLSVSLAHAQERRERREHERERFQTPHWVFDDRFHHNHYYPAVGYAVDVLPTGNVVVNFGSGRFWFHSGVWFQQAGSRFVVVRPPVGVLVPRSEEHTSELQSQSNLVCRLLLEKKNTKVSHARLMFSMEPAPSYIFVFFF